MARLITGLTWFGPRDGIYAKGTDVTRILITGGGGFLGQKLARALAEAGHMRGRAISSMVLADIAAPGAVEAGFEVRGEVADMSRPGDVARIWGDGFDVIYHLAAVVSGAAEADFDLGMQANLMGTMNLCQAARAAGTAPVFVYASSVAVHGGEVPDPVPEGAELNPQTSYGTQKAMGELLLQDMSRKGFIDGRGLRLPTVTVRPGKANAAASSFMSSIFRDTIEGRTANCPVSKDYLVWHSSPRTVVRNLCHAAEVDGAAFGFNRNINLPGRSDTIGEMIEAMRAVAGDAPVDRITWERDPAVEAIALGWRGQVAHEKALKLGFVADESFKASIENFIADDMQNS